MADVFISYSRKDIQFAQRIHHELEARDREPWVDWQDIPPTAEWLDEVYAGIQEADTFLFIISPDSVVSEICTLEIEHAVQHNKRLVPVVLHDVDDDQVHSTMSAHNWVFLREEDNFEANFELLIDALDTDLEYVREHTRLLTLAIDWDKNQRRRSAVLRGQELKTAEGWLEQSGSKDPKPTELHREYLIFSRTVVNRLQRLVVSSVTVAFVLVLGLAVFSFHKSTVAEKTARISNSRSLAALALTEMDKDPELSILLARQSIRVTYQENRTVLPLSNTALRESIIKSRVRLVLEGHSGSVNSAIYSPGGQRIVTGSSDNTAKVWDANTGKELFTLKGHEGGVISVAYGPDGQRIVTASADKTAKVWDAETEKELMTLQGHDGYVNSAVYSLDGQRIVTAGRSDKTAKIWDAQTGQELMTLQGHDGSVLADVLPSHLNLADVLADKSTHRGWKIPETTLAYPWIIRMFPDIKYIHWIRDPRDCILGGHKTDDLRDFGIDYPLTDDVRKRRAISWLYQYELMKSTPKPKNYIVVRFEDFILKQEETLERLEDFLGMPLARIIVRPDSVGRWKTADGNYNFDFLEESLEENQYHQDSV